MSVAKDEKTCELHALTVISIQNDFETVPVCDDTSVKEESCNLNENLCDVISNENVIPQEKSLSENVVNEDDTFIIKIECKNTMSPDMFEVDNQLSPEQPGHLPENKVHFASPLTVLHEYEEISQCTSQSQNTDSMDIENMEKEGIDEVEVMGGADLEHSEMHISNNNNNFGEFSDDKIGHLEMATNNVELIGDSKVIPFVDKPELSVPLINPNMSVPSSSNENTLLIDEHVRDLLLSLVERCCQMSLHKTTSLNDKTLVDQVTNNTSLRSLESYNDLAKFPIETSDEKLQNSLLQCDDCSAASRSIDQSVQGTEINVLNVCAQSVLEDTEVSLLSNIHFLNRDESEKEINESIIDKNVKNSLDIVTESEPDCHSKTETHENSIDSDFQSVKDINAKELEIKEKSYDIDKSSFTDVKEKANFFGKNEDSFKSSEINSFHFTESENNELINDHCNDNSKSNFNHPNCMKNDFPLTHEISLTKGGQSDGTILEKLAVNPYSFCDTVEIKSTNLNASFNTCLHVSDTVVREKKLHITDKETEIKFTNADVLEENQIVSADSQIKTEHLEDIMPSKSESKSQLEDSLKCYHNQDRCESLGLELPCNLLRNNENKNSLTFIQNCHVQSNPLSNQICNTARTDEVADGETEKFLSAADFDSSKLSVEDYTITTVSVKAEIVPHGLKRCQGMTSTSDHIENYQLPCKLQKYDIIDCSLSGEYSTGKMDQAVPEEANLDQEMDIDMNAYDNESIYHQEHGLEKSVMDCAGDNDLDLKEEQTTDDFEHAQKLSVSDECCSSKPCFGINSTLKTHCFKWKYVPSCELEDSGNVNQGIEDDSSFVVPPLQTCNKPIRIGLSRKQRVQHLHPKLKVHTSD